MGLYQENVRQRRGNVPVGPQVAASVGHGGERHGAARVQTVAPGAAARRDAGLVPGASPTAHLGEDPGREQDDDEGSPTKEGPLDVLVADAAARVPVGAGTVASADAATLVVVVREPTALLVDITYVSLSL